MPFPSDLLVTQEVDARQAFRSTDAIVTSVALLIDGLPVDAALTHHFPTEDAVAAFEIAGDRSRASKVLLDSTG